MVKENIARELPVQQLLILSICRFAEPISLTSVFPYLPEMIESFGVPRDEVSKWAGVTSAVYSLSQAVTGIAWGQASDRFGRKPVTLVAMMCIMTTSLLFGFSRTLVWAIVARSLAGASCGNVGIIRTMVAEMVPYKELQPKAFSVMPLVWTIGSIFGPSLGGALANPALKYPMVFGESGLFGTYQFALPNLVGAAFFLVGLMVGTLFLKETLETKKDRRDYGIILGDILLLPFTRKKPGPKWSLEGEQSASLLKHSRDSSAASLDTDTDAQGNRKAVPVVAPPTYREVFSRQSNLNLLTYSLLALHSLAYDQLLPIFMHYPQQTDRSMNPDVHLPFKFTGGFGLNSDRIGLLFTVYGVFGMLIQFFVFPSLARHYGVLPCLKVVTTMFPVAYIITPFTALLPTPTTQQIGLLVVLMIKCWAGIFAFPCTTILLTNSAVSLRILGTLNGVAVSISAIGRAVGPAIGGYSFTVGVNKGYGILPWWVLGCFGILGAIAPWWLVEMEGFGGSNDDSDNDEAGQDEAIPHNNSEEEEQPSAILIASGPLSEMGEDHDQFGIEGNPLSGSEGLSKKTRVVAAE
ncbi:hypothetical protein HO133_009073 [Letharia lupina]|uniref:Major facilitator superfamily (MFS) profile domain-containing protein n=1 Tax=Letharia lupina TaxID=560253 RepID=A0A8H6FF54_9LECA|nr:uncharacterized protein HO133_009073 [Letharia lupina]KAF6226207.1 hypothetical protein HO133_009073 [Letharia lupina]